MNQFMSKLAIILLLMGMAAGAQAAVFMKNEGIDGESRAGTPNHQNQVKKPTTSTKLPPLQKVRDAAARSSYTNNLKQLD